MLLSTTWVRTVLTLSSYESITWDSLWNTGLCQYYQAAGQSVVANCAFKEGTNTVRSQKTQSCDPVHANQLKTLIVLSKLKKKHSLFKRAKWWVSSTMFTHSRDLLIHTTELSLCHARISVAFFMKFGDICASSRQTQFQSLIGWENALQDFLFNLPGQTVSPGFPAISVSLEYVVRCMVASSFPLCFSAKEHDCSEESKISRWRFVLYWHLSIVGAPHFAMANTGQTTGWSFVH